MRESTPSPCSLSCYSVPSSHFLLLVSFLLQHVRDLFGYQGACPSSSLLFVGFLVSCLLVFCGQVMLGIEVVCYCAQDIPERSTYTVTSPPFFMAPAFAAKLCISLGFRLVRQRVHCRPATSSVGCSLRRCSLLHRLDHGLAIAGPRLDHG